MSLLQAQYYDHPEGHDLMGKIVAANRYAAIAGLTWSTFDVLMLTKTQGYLPTVARFAYNTGPMMGMATAFTLTTYLSTNVRGKDDRLNYFFGGIAAGTIFGCWKRNVMSGFNAALFLGLFATVKKLSKQEGWQFFPDPPLREITTVNPHDFTLMKDPARN